LRFTRHEYLALKGVDLLLKTVANIQKRAGSALAVHGIVLTLAGLRTLHAWEGVQAARETFGQNVPILNALIHANVRLKQAPLTGQRILAYAPDSPGALVYRALAHHLAQVAEFIAGRLGP
jgi:chromosome partitioning protein